MIEDFWRVARRRFGWKLGLAQSLHSKRFWDWYWSYVEGGCGIVG